MKKQWLKFIVVLVLYLAFLVWVKSLALGNPEQTFCLSRVTLTLVSVKLTTANQHIAQSLSELCTP